jgi:hypothetical protein
MDAITAADYDSDASKANPATRGPDMQGHSEVELAGLINFALSPSFQDDAFLGVKPD